MCLLNKVDFFRNICYLIFEVRILIKRFSKIIEYFRSTALYELITNTISALKNHKKIVSIVIIMIFAVGISTYPIIDQMFNGSKTNTEKPVYTDLTSIKIYVTLAGEVTNPGMYEMTTDDRINDAIKKAGGFTENSYTDNINLAQKLEDGQYIYILSVEQGKSLENESNFNSENGFQGIVNINTATIDELCKLPGIGEKTAEKIIEYREELDGFDTIEELKNVEGIGESKFNKIKFNITV